MRAKELFGIACVVTCVMAMIQGFALVANDEGAEELESFDNYYFCSGHIVGLYEHPTKVVRISMVNEASVLVGKSKMKHIKCFQDTLLNATVYEYIETNGQRRALEMHNGNLLPCYYDESGTELIPSGMLDVRLKRIEDFARLGDMVAPYNCKVIGNKPYYEKFCMLYVDPSLGGNPVDISRELYESGLFLSSNPDFHFAASDFSYDPYITKQWSLYNKDNDTIHMSVSKAWNYCTGRGI